MRRVAAVLFTVAVVTAICFVAIPFWVIQPMKPQGARALALSMWLVQHGGLVTAVIFVFALATFVWLWADVRPAGRLALALGVLVSAALAGLAQINYFEWYFRPNPAPSFVRAGDAALDKSDMVLAIHEAGIARAYPIREMAYHHVINDVVGGVPVVATY